MNSRGEVIGCNGVILPPGYLLASVILRVRGGETSSGWEPSGVTSADSQNVPLPRPWFDFTSCGGERILVVSIETSVPRRGSPREGDGIIAYEDQRYGTSMAGTV